MLQRMNSIDNQSLCRQLEAHMSTERLGAYAVSIREMEVSPKLVLFTRLCRHDYGIDPVAAAGYVQAHREMWDMPDEVVFGGGV